MVNWFPWQTDYGKLAYGELENGETTSYKKYNQVTAKHEC